MKDSGIKWIGEVPKNWRTCKVKQILRNKSIKGFPYETVLSLYRDYGVVPKESRDDNHNVTSEDTASYKFVEVGNFVINKMKAWQGSMAVSNYQGIISPAYYICEFIDYSIEKKYIHYLLRNETYKVEYQRLSTGLRVGQWDLNINDFMTIPIILPPLSEQQKIANHLDIKCTEIDNLISLQEEMIAELKAYKQSVITEAVCKGLDKNVPMKDSGVEWIGEIPEHWKAIQIRNIIKVSSSKRVFEESYKDIGIPFYRSKEVATLSDGVECNPNIFISRELFEKVNLLSPSPKKGDILLTSIGTIGKTWISDGREFYYKDGNLTQLTISSNAVSEYINYCFKSNMIYKQYEMLSVGSTLLALTIQKISKLSITFPPLSEQQAIANYLDKKCANIDELISIKQQKADELKEYKKSMIYEYVTGKKEVI